MEDLALVVAVIDGLGEGFFFWVLDMAAVNTDPFLESHVAFGDLVLIRHDLGVFGLDFLEQMGDFCGRVCHCGISQFHMVCDSMGTNGGWRSGHTIVHELLEHGGGIFGRIQIHLDCWVTTPGKLSVQYESLVATQQACTAQRKLTRVGDDEYVGLVMVKK